MSIYIFHEVHIHYVYQSLWQQQRDFVLSEWYYKTHLTNRLLRCSTPITVITPMIHRRNVALAPAVSFATVYPQSHCLTTQKKKQLFRLKHFATRLERATLIASQFRLLRPTLCDLRRAAPTPTSSFLHSCIKRVGTLAIFRRFESSSMAHSSHFRLVRIPRGCCLYMCCISWLRRRYTSQIQRRNRSDKCVVYFVYIGAHSHTHTQHTQLTNNFNSPSTVPQGPRAKREPIKLCLKMGEIILRRLVLKKAIRLHSMAVTACALFAHANQHPPTTPPPHQACFLV